MQAQKPRFKGPPYKLPTGKVTLSEQLGTEPPAVRNSLRHKQHQCICLGALTVTPFLN